MADGDHLKKFSNPQKIYHYLKNEVGLVRSFTESLRGGAEESTQCVRAPICQVVHSSHPKAPSPARPTSDITLPSRVAAPAATARWNAKPDTAPATPERHDGLIISRDEMRLDKNERCSACAATHHPQPAAPRPLHAFVEPLDRRIQHRRRQWQRGRAPPSHRRSLHRMPRGLRQSPQGGRAV